MFTVLGIQKMLPIIINTLLLLAMPSENARETKESTFRDLLFSPCCQTSLEFAQCHEPLLLHRHYQEADCHNYTAGGVRPRPPSAPHAWDRQFAFCLEPWQVLNSYSLLVPRHQVLKEVAFFLNAEQLSFSLFLAISMK